MGVGVTTVGGKSHLLGNGPYALKFHNPVHCVLQHLDLDSIGELGFATFGP